jgi:hypothetical protein
MARNGRGGGDAASALAAGVLAIAGLDLDIGR